MGLVKIYKYENENQCNADIDIIDNKLGYPTQSLSGKVVYHYTDKMVINGNICILHNDLIEKILNKKPELIEVDNDY